jgi:hypothetical protein
MDEGDNNFFGAPPAEGAPEDAPLPAGDGIEEANDGGFTFLGDAPPVDVEGDAPFVGDVNEAPPADMGFAGPSDDMGFSGASDDMGFAGAPVDDAYAPPDAFAAPAEDAPIILAPPDEAAPEEPAQPAEPSAMQKWNVEWQETLTARKDEENTKKSEMVEGARVSMEKFDKDLETKRESKSSKNREDEQAKLEAIEADLENDNSWQRVCKMVELSHDGAGNSEDTKRMRDVLILLKNEPARAAAVGA